MAVAVTPNIKLAAVCSAYFYSLFNLFAGFTITQPNMPGWWYASTCPRSECCVHKRACMCLGHRQAQQVNSVAETVFSTLRCIEHASLTMMCVVTCEGFSVFVTLSKLRIACLFMQDLVFIHQPHFLDCVWPDHHASGQSGHALPPGQWRNAACIPGCTYYLRLPVSRLFCRTSASYAVLCQLSDTVNLESGT